MAKILIVDDEEDQEELILQRFSRKPFLKDYEFVFANNGLNGLQLVKKHSDIEIALLDINMPEMDGLTLLEKIKEINPIIQVVILSAYGDMSNIRTAMNRGAYDFLNKPIEFNDLEATIKKTIAEVFRLKENARILHENLHLKQKASELEMRALRAQMNPHFIFNSLNSINNFILQNDKNKASEYLIKFSKLIRLILENSAQPLITLAQELDALKLYIDLESLRFNHRFEYHVTLSDELDSASIKVPPLILQPFIENAIHHGLMSKPGTGQILLSIEDDGNKLKIKIEDNGIGRKQALSNKKSSTLKHKSMGMAMTNERITLISSMDSTANILINDLVDSQGLATGTEITIFIPLIV
ncbi:MAG: histidine kinase [Saprospiraceae bacterium]